MQLGVFRIAWGIFRISAIDLGIPRRPGDRQRCARIIVGNHTHTQSKLVASPGDAFSEALLGCIVYAAELYSGLWLYSALINGRRYLQCN